MLRNFTKQELASPDTGELILAPGFGIRLQELRDFFGLAMQVNSCCRTPTHNDKVGGNPNSFHLTANNGYDTRGTCAIDVDTSEMTGWERSKLLFCASVLGWSVGVYHNFLHLDRRSDYTELPQTIFKGGS